MRYIIHHDDADGWMAAACLLELKPEKDNMVIAAQYGDQMLDPVLVTKQDEVWVLDFSCPEMVEYEERAGAFYWIDHHKTAIQKYGGHNFNGYRDIDNSGCELTYWFAENECRPSLSTAKLIPLPRPVELIGAYDTWRWKQLIQEEQDAVLHFHAAVNDFDDPVSTLRDILRRPALMPHYMTLGEAIHKHDMKIFRRVIEKRAWTSYYRGQRIVSVNGPQTSMLWESVPWYRAEGTVYCSYTHFGSYYTVSLRSVGDLDVSAIAKEFGGGGHKNAAGFSCNELPWRLNDE